MKPTELDCDHFLLRYILLAALLVLLLVSIDHVFAQGSASLHVYGPGGPAPAMKEAAKEFEHKTGTAIIVTAGPTAEWIEQAMENQKTNGLVCY